MGAMLLVRDQQETSSLYGEKELGEKGSFCGSDMRMSMESSSKQHLPAWLLDRKAEAQERK